MTKCSLLAGCLLRRDIGENHEPEKGDKSNERDPQVSWDESKGQHLDRGPDRPIS